MTTQYVIPPPNIPQFLFKHYSDTMAKRLIEWAKKEFDLRIRYCADRRYYRELKWLNENSSPIRILAELPNYRKICSYFTDESWNRLSARERSFVRRAYELREILVKRRLQV